MVDRSGAGPALGSAPGPPAAGSGSSDEWLLVRSGRVVRFRRRRGRRRP